jgi:hypothetical protein
VKAALGRDGASGSAFCDGAVLTLAAQKKPKMGNEEERFEARRR